MRAAVFLLFVVPLILAAPERKFILDQLANQFGNIISLDVLKQDVQIMLDVLGGDPLESACEAECNKLLASGSGDNLLQHSCPLVCHSFQALVHYFNLTPDGTTTMSAMTSSS